nr:unnamed protein product [Callosobruchus chinensis]
MPPPNRSSPCGVTARSNARDASRVLHHSEQSQPQSDKSIREATPHLTCGTSRQKKRPGRAAVQADCWTCCRGKVTFRHWIFNPSSLISSKSQTIKFLCEMFIAIEERVCSIYA